MGSWIRRGLALVVLLAAVAVGEPGATAATATERTSGYLTMADGVQLSYTVVRPATGGPYPTLFEYSGYAPGIQPDASYIKRFVESGRGYAYIGVNLRGTGCSEGTFDFFQPQEAKDGAAVIKWITEQDWSDGKVGMIGKSYPGITQLFVAEEQPPGLVAIAPGHFYADAYRDVARPGGIINKGFSTLWSFIGRPSYEFTGAPPEVAGGNLMCVNGSTSELRGLPTNPFVQLMQHPFDDQLVQERSPARRLDRIKVPMLATLAWQDEQLASRQTHLLADLETLNTDRAAKGEPVTPWWATLTTGDHGMARTSKELADLDAFYDHFLKGKDNGWESRPRVQVWWEAGRDAGARAPAWTTNLARWGEKARTDAGELEALPLYLRADGRLDRTAPTEGEAPDTYLYTPGAGSQGIGNPYYGYPSLPNQYLWDYGPPPGTFAAYTTEPFASEQTFLGSASLDLWLSSAAPDTDVQVTLTEVRPDGQEMYIQKGWLRASQRALDPARSTALRPFQTHQEADVADLPAGEPSLMRVEIFPFGHVVRADSRLRVWIEAPTILPELWSFVPNPQATQNTVFHDEAHASALVLPLVDNQTPADRAALPDCTLIRQPCRPDALGAGGASAGPAAPGSPGAPGGGGDAPGADDGRGALPATGSSLPILPLLVLALTALALLAAARSEDRNDLPPERR
jgi:putative CocE/NonD family hydrolase